MTRIKICGITNTADAIAAVEAGADALGFIRVAGSPRFVDPITVRQIGLRLPPFVSRVGVYRDAEDCVQDVTGDLPTGLEVCQFYGWSVTNRTRAALRYVLAARIHASDSFNEVMDLIEVADALLLDTFHPDRLGGSGQTFDWDIAVEAKERFDLPIILAGGLTPENVAEAVRRVRPFAVDVSSGVESSPGIKDICRVRAFIDAVRSADC